MSEPLTLEFDSFKTESGLMDCWLVVNGKRHQLELFAFFPPFHDLLNFVRTLDTKSLPYEFCWQEEGRQVYFYATQTEGQSDRFHLQIVDAEDTLVEADFDLQQTANSLLESLRQFALDCPEAGTEWQFPYFFIEEYERERANNFISDAHQDCVERVHFVFEHFDDSGRWTFLPIVTPNTRKINPSFYLWVGSRFMIRLHMGEGSRLWRLWFSLLEKIRRAELPVEAILDCRKRRDECASDLDYSVQPRAHGLCAEPALQPELFRLKSWWLSGDSGSQPLWDVQLERRQFVTEFVESFEEFLYTDYLAYLAGNANGFDLRTLPLEELKQE